MPFEEVPLRLVLRFLPPWTRHGPAPPRADIEVLFEVRDPALVALDSGFTEDFCSEEGRLLGRGGQAIQVSVSFQMTQALRAAPAVTAAKASSGRTPSEACEESLALGR